VHTKPHMVFVATRVPHPPVTGHYLRTFNILRGLSQHFSVHFFGFRDKSGTPAEHARADETLLGMCSSIHIEFVGAERSRARLLIDLLCSLLTVRPFTAAKYSSLTMHAAVRATFERYEIAVAHADSLQSGQYLTDASRPKLLTNHNVEYQRLYRYAAQRRSAASRLALRGQAWLTKRYERAILRAIGNCVVVSESDRIELAGLVPSARFFLVPNGADISMPPVAPAGPTAATALWVGGMNDPFNREGVLHFASRILPRIRERVPEFRWRVVGRDPPPLLQSLAADASSGVVLAGFVPALRDAYEDSAMVVAPLLSGGGTKLKVLEAMAMGRAVVTTLVGAEGIGACDGVEMEIANSDEEFAQKTVALLLDPARRNRMAAAARALAEREYGWEAVNRRMLSAVQSVISSRSDSKVALPCAE
jgi:glycosyltransferase involved in cell wall biosynthesis